MPVRIAFPVALAVALTAAGPLPAAATPRYAATITRTAQGVPHVVARDMAGLGYGSGYAAAEDNGCIVADSLLTVRGERSLFLGATARVTVGFNEIANLESDFFHRITGDLPQLRRAFARTSRDHRAVVDGFVAGYNRFLRETPSRFAASCRGAAWLRPMARDDALLLLLAGATQGSSAPLARYLSTAAPARSRRSRPPPRCPASPAPTRTPAAPATAGPSAPRSPPTAAASSSETPHFPWTGHNRYRRLHLTIPGRFDVMGAALSYSPFVSIGFTRHIAWTHTASTAQHQSLYELKLDPADPTRYLIDGKPEAMTRRQVTVAVKDGAPVTRTLYATRYGPAVALPGSGLGWGTARAYTLRDAELGNIRSGDAWLGIARARSVEGIRDALARTLGMPSVNTLAADAAGRTLYADITPVPNLPAAPPRRVHAGRGQHAYGRQSHDLHPRRGALGLRLGDRPHHARPRPDAPLAPARPDPHRLAPERERQLLAVQSDKPHARLLAIARALWWRARRCARARRSSCSAPRSPQAGSTPKPPSGWRSRTASMPPS
ncbi:MAG: penicillin acylase family protein [Sphingomonas sp.]